MLWYELIWDELVRPDLIWSDLIWSDLIWSDMVWYDIYDVYMCIYIMWSIYNIWYMIYDIYIYIHDRWGICDVALFPKLLSLPFVTWSPATLDLTSRMLTPEVWRLMMWPGRLETWSDRRDPNLADWRASETLWPERLEACVLHLRWHWISNLPSLWYVKTE